MIYGLNLLLCAIAYVTLEQRIIAADGTTGVLKRAVGQDLKGMVPEVTCSAMQKSARRSHAESLIN